MVSALKKVLDQMGSGDLETQDAVAKVQALVKTAPTDDSQDENLTLSERYGKALLDDDNDYDDTWSEVEAAYLSKKISQEQYDALRAADDVKPVAPQTE